MFAVYIISTVSCVYTSIHMDRSDSFNLCHVRLESDLEYIPEYLFLVLCIFISCIFLSISQVFGFSALIVKGQSGSTFNWRFTNTFAYSGDMASYMESLPKRSSVIGGSTGRSFVYTWYRSGPKTDPCGTPAAMGRTAKEATSDADLECTIAEVPQEQVYELAQMTFVIHFIKGFTDRIRQLQ